MLRLFDKLTLKTNNEQFVFNLSDSIQVTMELEEPPYYSRIYLQEKGETIANVSISSETAEKIEKYFAETQEHSNTNEAFLTQLKNLKLTNFVSIIEKYIEKSTGYDLDASQVITTIQ